MSETEVGGSGAGSTVESMPRGVVHDQGCHCWPHTEYAAIEAAQRELVLRKADIDYLLEVQKDQLARADGLIADLAQSRATEAELRAGHSAMWMALGGELNSAEQEHRKYVHVDQVRRVLNGFKPALDAAEQPARAEGGQG
jgi:hypothetical protein